MQLGPRVASRSIRGGTDRGGAGQGVKDDEREQTMNLETIRLLFDHMAWADELVLTALQTSPGEDPHAMEQFAHVLAAEHVWLRRIEERAASVVVWPALTLAECEALAAENRRAFTAFLAKETDISLTREVRYVNSAGRAFRSRVLDILLHVSLHGSYHRGQVSLMTRRSGGTPAPTDFIAFIRGAPTATRRDAEGASGDS